MRYKVLFLIIRLAHNLFYDICDESWPLTSPPRNSQHHPHQQQCSPRGIEREPARPPERGKQRGAIGICRRVAAIGIQAGGDGEHRQADKKQQV